MQSYLKTPGNVVNSNPNDFESPPKYNPDEFHRGETFDFLT